CMQAVELWTF
nr:immunoglobulin light chain junction region [Macaca mulatta]